MILRTILVSCAFSAQVSVAQGVYRCGSVFSEHPCGAGAQVLKAPPVRPIPVTALPDNPPPGATIAANKSACAAAIRASMKDPGAAQLGEVLRLGPAVDRVNGSDFQVVNYAANVNGKNSYGAYTGERLHLCAFDSAEKRILRVAEIGPGIR